MKPITERDNGAIRHLLAELARLDRNGWCNATDGSMDDWTDSEVIMNLTDSIAYIREME